ncbi:MAG: ribosome recycling factor [Candidatus Parcubacteria bacterium]|nr:ribosome recycling factor [Candidatus Parcubacteria bacterium]
MIKTNQFIEQKKKDFEEAIEHFKKEISSLRTGRAQTALVESVMVESYGAHTPLKQLAAISIPEAKSISIEPWDKNILKDVEKSLNYSNLGLSIINTGEKIIAKLPAMTEENRKELTKLLGQKSETAKISLRQIRDKVKEAIIEAEKGKSVTQDDKFQFLADLDNYISDLNSKLETLTKDKEKEIMTV